VATLNLGEAVIDGVIAKLREGMPARIAAINAQSADDWVLEPPHEYYFGGVSEIPLAPCAIVFQLPTEGEHEGEGPHSFVWVADVGVALVEQDYDRQRLARKLLRQVKASAEVLWDDPPPEQLQNGPFHVRFVRDDPGPVQEPQAEGAFWRAMHVAVFRVRSYEG
jgi:hypothetical protein